MKIIQIQIIMVAHQNIRCKTLNCHTRGVLKNCWRLNSKRNIKIEMLMRIKEYINQWRISAKSNASWSYFQTNNKTPGESSISIIWKVIKKMLPLNKQMQIHCRRKSYHKSFGRIVRLKKKNLGSFTSGFKILYQDEASWVIALYMERMFSKEMIKMFK